MVSNNKAWMIEGVAASPGIVIGKAVILKKAKVDVKPTAIGSAKVKKEISDFKKAIAMVKNDLQKLAVTIGQRLDPDWILIRYAPDFSMFCRELKKLSLKMLRALLLLLP